MNVPVTVYAEMTPNPSTMKFVANKYLLITGDTAIIGVACSIVSDITNGKYKLLKWDRQEKTYYPLEINIFQN